MFNVGGPATKMYAAGNQLDHAKTVDAEDWKLIEHATAENKLDAPLPATPVTTDPAETAMERVLAEAGATLPRRDAVDARVVDEVRLEKGKVINSPSDVGGWPKYASSEAPTDTDGDGIPDEWERQHQLDPNNAADGAFDRDGDGYSNVEEYLNGIVGA